MPCSELLFQADVILIIIEKLFQLFPVAYLLLQYSGVDSTGLGKTNIHMMKCNFNFNVPNSSHITTCFIYYRKYILQIKQPSR